ncbi:hypothetical protein EHQ23_08155 [Leptospira bourretii]|uniref:Lipoprotein n=1 Tax=Leptospira bourretii TaxID=2484962 RepID=A0A4R9ISL3_9LEPT|nr:hypothetical protein [Leptospira bourretii]TGK86220.1 hypothetical protein EHQ23_08155 [Leptospira bourretii]TGK94969.1 hypothetical protein EHQ26_00025 [Leptospira bourretii]TGL42469.1 hypothetical protein EHQ45_02370 [Leptospira bourretii]
METKFIFTYLLLILSCCNQSDAQKNKALQNDKKVSDYIDHSYTIKNNSLFVNKQVIVFDAGNSELFKELDFDYEEEKNPENLPVSLYCAEFDVSKSLLRLYFVKGKGDLNLTIVSQKGENYYLLNEKKSKILMMKIEESKSAIAPEMILREYKIYSIDEKKANQPLISGGASHFLKTYSECIDWYSKQFEAEKKSDEQEAMTPEDYEKYKKRRGMK